MSKDNGSEVVIVMERIMVRYKSREILAVVLDFEKKNEKHVYMCRACIFRGVLSNFCQYYYLCRLP